MHINEIPTIGDLANHLKYEKARISLVGSQQSRTEIKNRLNNIYKGFYFDTAILNTTDPILKERIANTINNYINVPKLSDYLLEFDNIEALRQ